MESLEELQIAAKITEEEGDTPMLSYIRRLIDQVARALAARRPLGEPARQRDCSEETKPTTVLPQRKECPDSKGDADKTPRDRQCAARSDLQVARGDSATLAVVEVEKRKKKTRRKTKKRRGGRKKRVTSVSSSSFSSLLSVSSAVPLQEDSSAQLRHENGSDQSLRSGRTTATYVVREASRSPSGNLEQVASDNEEEEEAGVVGVEEGGERATGGGFGELLECQEERGDMLNAVSVIEELGKKDEAELLQMLRDMLLPTEVKGDLEDSGDGFRGSRSGEQRNEVATSRTASLPISN